MARYVHAHSQARQQAVHLGQLRRDPREPAGIRAVRPREGRLHRRRRAPHRQVRGSQRRHAAARRDQRDGPAPAGQAAARHPGARDRPRRRHHAGEGRHPHARHLQPRPAGGGARGHVPRRPALPPQRREPAACRRCASGRRDIAALAEHFVEEIRRGQRRVAIAASRRRSRDALRRATAGAATCASSRTPCTARCCWRSGAEIEPDAICLPDGRRVPVAALRRSRGGRAPVSAAEAAIDGAARWSAAPWPTSSAT